jgi:hypothetical protein
MHWIFFTYGMKKIQRMAAGSRPTENPLQAFAYSF